MKNMFNVTTVLPHNLLQTNPRNRHNFSTQIFRKRAAQLHCVGPELRYSADGTDMLHLNADGTDRLHLNVGTKLPLHSA